MTLRPAIFVCGACSDPLSFVAGKTLLAKAVANQTSATFLRVVGSELIQKYLVSECLTGVYHVSIA